MNMSGPTTDKKFLTDMIAHHQAALSMSRAIFKTTQRPELKTFASKIFNAQSAEIAKMKSWLSEWYRA